MNNDRIDEILSTMDIPSMRRDTGDISNLRWLSRNVGIQNAHHPQFHELRDILNQLLAIGE
jgi:hypothetical protein